MGWNLGAPRNNYPLKYSQAVKKVWPYATWLAWKKLWNIGGGQEMAVMVGQWNNFNNDNSGESVLPHPSFTRNRYKIHLNYHY